MEFGTLVPSEVRRCLQVDFLILGVVYPKNHGDSVLTLDIVGSHILKFERGLGTKILPTLDLRCRAISLSGVATRELRIKYLV